MQHQTARIWQWLLTLAIAVVYLCYPTKNYYWDGVDFATQIETVEALSPALFHPSHLIYNILGSAVYAVAKNTNLRALEVLQITNSLLGALCAFVFFDILKTAFRSAYLAIVFTAFFAFSATWWKFATDANAYIPSILFLLIALRLLLPEQTARPFIVAAIHCVAMLFHQLAIFFLPVAVLGLFFQTACATSQKRWQTILEYCVTAGFLTLLNYLAGFYLKTSNFNLKEFVRWTTYYSTEHGFAFDFSRNLSYTLRGHARLFFDGRFNFAKFGEILVDTVLIVTLAVLLFAFTFKVVKGFQNFALSFSNARRKINLFQPLTLLCFVWWTVYTVFLFFFIPQNTFYRLFYLPALIILLAGVSANLANLHKHRGRSALFVAIAAIANFVFFIQPYSRVRAETPLALAKQMNQIWNQQTVVYYALPNSDNSLIKYFNQTTTWEKLDAVDLNEFTFELQNIYQSGGNAWLDASALELIKRAPNSAQWLTDHIRADSQYKLRDPAYNVSFVQVLP